MPVNIISFKGEKNETNDVLLEWQTNSEINNDYFTIEKSTDAIHYDFLARVNGAGNSNAPLSYNYTDINPGTGIKYYRLMQTDYDGTISNAGLIAVDCIMDNAIIQNFKIYPTLLSSAQNQLTIELPYEDEYFSVRVFSVDGKEITNAKLLNLSLNKHIIETPFNLVPGIYYVKIYSVKNNFAGRFVKE